MIYTSLWRTKKGEEYLVLLLTWIAEDRDELVLIFSLVLQIAQNKESFYEFYCQNLTAKLNLSGSERSLQTEPRHEMSLRESHMERIYFLIYTSCRYLSFRNISFPTWIKRKAFSRKYLGVSRIFFQRRPYLTDWSNCSIQIYLFIIKRNLH